MRDYEFSEWIGVCGDVMGYFNLEGKPVKKNPRLYPYSYDSFVLFKSGAFSKTDVMADSDRMRQWDQKAFTAAMLEVWPNNPESHGFSKRKPADVSRFLSLYYKREVKLTALLQNCNASSGSPYWTFAFTYLN